MPDHRFAAAQLAQSDLEYLVAPMAKVFANLSIVALRSGDVMDVPAHSV